jgi:uncharacterized protein
MVAVSRRPLAFVALTAALSVPFWAFGAAPLGLPVALPVGALTVVCPLVAALVLVGRGRRRGLLRALVARRGLRWPHLPLVLLPLGLLALTWAAMVAAGRALPPLQVDPGTVALLLALFLVAAAAEEAGWSGYLTPALRERHGPVATGLVVGALWAAWHLVGWAVQTGHGPAWVAGQAVSTVAIRVVMVHLLEATGGSVLATALFHAASNLGQFLFPAHGSHYDPVAAAPLAVLAAAAVVLGARVRGRRPARAG